MQGAINRQQMPREIKIRNTEKGVFVPADLETMTGVEATAGSRRKRIAPSVLVLQLRLVCLAAACMGGAFLLGRAMAGTQKQKQR
jgi:hypothetical protein